jgi:recombination associated protein RdgC
MWRSEWAARLQEHAFQDNPIEVGKEEREGWVQIHNLLETSFEDPERWLYGDVIVLALRVDKKSLPAKLLRATLEKAYADWCTQNNVKRCPKSIRDDIRDRIEGEWLQRALPQVAVTELAYHVGEGYVLLHSLSDGAADRVRKRFHATFGLRMVPLGPLDLLEDGDLRQSVLDVVPSQLGDHPFGGDPRSAGLDVEEGRR